MGRVEIALLEDSDSTRVRLWWQGSEGLNESAFIVELWMLADDEKIELLLTFSSGREAILPYCRAMADW